MQYSFKIVNNQCQPERQQLHTEPSCDFILSNALQVQHNTVQYIIVYCPEESHKERLRRKEVRYIVQHEKDEPRQTKTKQKKSPS
jgi:hypothetical protein